MIKRALLVNDSRFESLVLRDILIKLDYDVEIANEFDALYEVEQFSPDIVIVNLIMQEIRGDKLIQLIKVDRPDVKCLLSSNNPIKTIDFENSNVDGIIRTPVTAFTLKDVLKRIGELDRKDNKGRITPSFSIEDEIEEQSSICSSCKKDVSAFPGIVFCPYCGHEL